MEGWGDCLPGKRFELCEIDDLYVVLAGNKIKTPKAKIIAVDGEAWNLLLQLTSGIFLGSLDLRDYEHKLPDGFTYCGGSLYLRGYKHKLPDGFTHCGGYLYLRDYKHKLPDGLTKEKKDKS